MKCPKCNEEMEVRRSGTTHTRDQKKLYSMQACVCRKDDIWIRIDQPKEAQEVKAS